MKHNQKLFVFSCAIFVGIAIVYFVQSFICKSSVNYVYNNYYNYYNNLKNSKEKPITNTTTKSYLNILKIVPKNHSFPLGEFKIEGKTIKIFLFGLEDYLSNRIMKLHDWEGDNVTKLLQFLGDHPGSLFIDLGCNVGVYSLAVASVGYPVIAVDASRDSTDRLMQSVVANKFTDRVTIISNAISDVRKIYSMNSVPYNRGKQIIREWRNIDLYKINSILLDDLIELTNQDSEIIIKMDISGSEVDALKHASDLFEKRNIIAVFMQWYRMKGHKNFYYLIRFFRSRKFRPYADFESQNELKVSTFFLWPYHIVWRYS